MLQTHGMAKYQILMALYDASRVQGMGFLRAVDGPLSEEEAVELAAKSDWFDYLKGRVMKISLTDLDPFPYDRDNGPGAAQWALDDFYTRG